ncbi:hypothetical protein ACWD5Q_08885 [Streptomyces sp. NPDC002513]
MSTAHAAAGPQTRSAAQALGALLGEKAAPLCRTGGEATKEMQ